MTKQAQNTVSMRISVFVCVCVRVCVCVCVFVFAVRISVKGLICSQCGHESIPSPQGVQSQFYDLSALMCVCDSESQRKENMNTRA